MEGVYGWKGLAGGGKQLQEDGWGVRGVLNPESVFPSFKRRAKSHHGSGQVCGMWAITAR